MLIVEGPDGAGKTTLIEAIQEYFGDIEVAPRVVSKDAEAMVDLQRWVDKNLDEGFQYKLFDRHRLISEPIYGPALGRSANGFNDLTWVGPRINTFYREVKPVIIYCLPDKGTVMRNIIDDPDNETIAPHISSIYDAYVNKAAVDLEMHDRTLVWNYEHSMQKDGLPWFMYSLRDLMQKAANR